VSQKRPDIRAGPALIEKISEAHLADVCGVAGDMFMPDRDRYHRIIITSLGVCQANAWSPPIGREPPRFLVEAGRRRPIRCRHLFRSERRAAADPCASSPRCCITLVSMTALSLLLLLLSVSAASVLAESSVYLREQFEDGDSWTSRWVESKHKTDYGAFVLTAGKFYGDAENDKGLQTSQDARFYAVSTRFDDFSNKGQPLVIQFTVKHEQSIDCGGGYIKLFPSSLNQEAMHGDSVYNIMFGPDICGPGTKKVHVIFNYQGKNHLINKDIRCKDDEYSHLYTLIVNPDNTYEVKIDNKKVESGNLEEDWDFLPPKKVKDPEAKKPEDWDDREQIPDPEDKKTEDWDQPENIPDPDAKKPDDWDEEMDGEWEPPMVTNPDYK
ncbi:unnamed protein product, partial [Pleuronectes platessa]